MEVPMFEVAFECDEVNFTVCFHKEDAIKMLEEGEYMRSFFTELRKNTNLWAEIGLPPDVDISKIRLVNASGRVIYAGKNSDGTLLQQDTSTNMSTATEECSKISKGNWNDIMIRLLIALRLGMDEQFNLAKPKNKLWAQIAQILGDRGYIITADECSDTWNDLVLTFQRNKEIAMRSGESAVVWPYFSLLNNGLFIESNTSSLNDSLKDLPPLYNDDDGQDHEVPSIPTLLVSETGTSSTATLPNSLRSAETPYSRLKPTARKQKSTYNSRNHAKRLKQAIMKLNNNHKNRSQVKKISRDPDELPDWMVKYIKKVEEANRIRDAIEEKRWNALAERENRRIELEERKLKAMYELIDALKK